MPQLERWDNLPEPVRQHLIERMRDRAISVSDLNQLRLWVETRPEVPDGDWYKDFGSFKILIVAESISVIFQLEGLRLPRGKTEGVAEVPPVEAHLDDMMGLGLR